MGATLWYHVAHGHSDPDVALKALQTDFLTENYDLATLLPQHLIWARESVATAKGEGDPYGLLDQYQQKVELLEGLCDRPIPENADRQIEIIRNIWADSGEGIGNVLDVIGVSSGRDFLMAQQLSEKERTRLVGTNKPSLTEAEMSIGKIHGELRRGECVCFPIYESDSVAGWYFVGNTID